MDISIWDKESHGDSALGIDLVTGEYKFIFNFPLLNAQTLIDNIMPHLPQLLYTKEGKQFTLTKYSLNPDNENELTIHLTLHENLVGCISICIAIGAVLLIGIAFLTKVERVVSVAPFLLPIAGYIGYKMMG